MGLRTKNQFRDSKIHAIQAIWDQYPDLNDTERLYMVILEFVRRADKKADYTQLPSLQEISKVIAGLYINPRTGRPSADGLNLVRRLITAIKKDEGHPHIRPYLEPHIELLATGIEVLRWYLNILRGRKEIQRVNASIDVVKNGLTENQRLNEDLKNGRAVLKEAENYAKELHTKQLEATRKRRISEAAGVS